MTGSTAAVAWTAAMLVGRHLVTAAEDDVIEQFPPQAQQIIAVNDLTFDQWIFGTDAARGIQLIDVQIHKAIQQVVNNFELDDRQRDRLSLAAHADKVRHLKEVDELRQRFNTTKTNLTELQLLSREARDLRQKQVKLLGPDSFFMKSIQKIVSDSTPHENEAVVIRHRANLDHAVRAIERRVQLIAGQREQLIELFSKEIPRPVVVGDFDDLVVKSQITRLPENKLKSLFLNHQWPQVQQVLADFHEFDGVLDRHGLLKSNGRLTRKPADPDKIREFVGRLQLLPEAGNPIGVRVVNAVRVVRVADPQPVPVKVVIDKGHFSDVKAGLQARHRSNVQSAVRVLERRVTLTEPQIKTLVELLMSETRVPAKFGDADDLFVQYQLAQLPEAKLKSIFNETQWPKVVATLEQLRELRPLLVRHGLITGAGLPAQRVDQVAADAAEPVNRGAP